MMGEEKRVNWGLNNARTDPITSVSVIGVEGVQ
jgi:hypothetical protein